MDRRSFVKRVLATAAVGAVAPKLLASEPPIGYTAEAVAAATEAVAAANICKLAAGGRVFTVVLDMDMSKWVWIPAMGEKVQKIIPLGELVAETCHVGDEIVFDYSSCLGDTDSAMMQRANHATFTPAANPQGHTPV